MTTQKRPRTHPRAKEQDTPDPLALNPRIHMRRWDDRSKLRTVSDKHFGYIAPVEVDIQQVKAKLDGISGVRQFKKTPKKGFVRDPVLVSRLVRVAGEVADRHFNQYTTNVYLIANVSPLDYRLAVCNALAETRITDGVSTFKDRELGRFVATICWIKLTEKFNGLFGEPLDDDYINYLDRSMLSVRLRRVAAYAELNYAYDYTNLLDLVYPVKDPSRWEKHPQCWGELVFCCLWRSQQSKFFKITSQKVQYERDGKQHEFVREYYI